MATCFQRTGIDLRDPSVVSAAFGALGAIAASAQPTTDSHLASHYAPMRSIRGGEAPETGQWDYGWINDWELEGRPRKGKPPWSKWHPDARIAALGRLAGQGPWYNEPKAHAKPNIAPPDLQSASVRTELRRRSRGD